MNAKPKSSSINKTAVSGPCIEGIDGVDKYSEVDAGQSTQQFRIAGILPARGVEKKHSSPRKQTI